MKTQRLFVLLMIMGFQTAFADPVVRQQTNMPNSTEQAIFGTPNYTTAPINNPDEKSIGKPVNARVVLKHKDLSRLSKMARDGNINAANAIKNAANEGDSNAALQYGYLAHTGKLPSMGTNYAIAMKAYKKAARQKDKNGQELGYLGNHLAAYNIGEMYQQGQGVPQSASEAYRWFKIANEAYQEKNANRSFYPAAVQMARALQSGVGVARDDKAAIQLWQSLMRENVPEAMTQYANMVLAGRGGMIKNPSIAISNYTLAANRWDLEAMQALAVLHTKGDSVAFEANLIESAKWYIILATVNKKKFGGKERAALAKLKNEHERKTVQRIAHNWLTQHATIPEPFDYTVPLSEEPKRYY